MCGIVGYTGCQPAAPILVDGLARLEYRGYDSAGIAVLNAVREVVTLKAPGKLSTLTGMLSRSAIDGQTGIGHTRWATHGAVTSENTHPLLDCSGRVAVVHNGIVENYLEVRAELEARGHRFRSETDTEVIPHLIEDHLQEGTSLREAVVRAARRIRGGNAFVAMTGAEPGSLAVVRLGNAGGVVVGHGAGEMFVASDVLAILPHTQKATYLQSGQVALVTPEGAQLTDLDGNHASGAARTAKLDPTAAVRGRFRHFMQKEIAEQAETVEGALRGRLYVGSPRGAMLERELGSVADDLAGLHRIVLLGMGSSYNACVAGRMVLQRFTGIPTTVENASEYRYQDPEADGETLAIAVTQSGESADTLGAMEQALARGARVIAFSNVEESQAARLAHVTLPLRAGPEIGVCATKTFTNTLALFHLLALHIGSARGTLPAAARDEAVHALRRLPEAVRAAVHDSEAPAHALAARLHTSQSMLYLGRGPALPVAMEGALKMKEVAYIHAEAYPAGEVKHGPMALVEQDLPVVAVVPPGRLHDKMLANMSEVRARGAWVVAVGVEGDASLRAHADHVLAVPDVGEMLFPLVATVPLQWLAYAVAVRRGCDVDQPRNLAKSVTVE